MLKFDTKTNTVISWLLADSTLRMRTHKSTLTKVQKELLFNTTTLQGNAD